MKRIIAVIFAIFCFYIGFAQTMTIHYKNGQNVKFNVESIDYIDFQEKGNDGGTTVSESEAVDLGLSVLWATRHVGATSCEQMGDKFAWGETETRRSFTRDNCIYYEKVTWTYTDIGKDISGTEFDVAHVKWGGKWRMPTLDEINELKKNCTWEWSRVNEVNGYKVIGKNGNSIFIPIIDGDTSFKSSCWTSCIPNDKEGAYSHACSFHLSGHMSINTATTIAERYMGHYIRPVMSK